MIVRCVNALLHLLSQRIAVLALHLEAENRHDLAGIMATYVDDPVVVINGVAIEGREWLFHQRFGFGGEGCIAEVRVDERARHILSNTIIIEQTLSGRQVLSWDGIDPTNRMFRVSVCTVYRFSDEGLLAPTNLNRP